MLESDRALLDAFRRGERAALTQVFRAYVDDVAATVRAGVVVANESGARTRVGNGMPEHDIEALIQETFARAFVEKARSGYDGLRPYGAYLATIARNLVIDRERARRRDNIAAVEDITVFAADERTDPAYRLEQQQLGAIVNGVKKQLGEPDLSIFRLRFEERESCRAIAASLGLREVVVRRRDARLRKVLLRALQSAGFLEHAQLSIADRLLRRREGS